MHTKELTLAISAILGSLVLAGCDLEVPDLNNPGLEELENNPTASGINTAATGLLIGQRGGKAATTGLVNQLGILGRESFDFDINDGRFVLEILEANLVKNSAFGGVFWAGNYANIRLGNIILHGVDKVAEFSDEEKAGLKGFAHTIQATDLLTVILTHESTGAVIDTDHALTDPLAPIVPRDQVYTEIARLLDQGRDELAGAGKAFTFPLSAGYKGFDTPATFTKFNRAVKARVAVYQASLAALKGNTTTQVAKYNEALTELGASFLDDVSATINFQLGVSYVYSTNKGDATNGLINTFIFAHPALQTDAQKQPDGTTLDARYVSKTDLILDKDKNPKPATSTVDGKLTTPIKFKIYPTNVTPIPFIRNEDLILLKAEALFFTGDVTNAIKELNIVRTNSGKLAPLAGTPSETTFIDYLLYERRYSLMFEGGHRWIDLRRFGRFGDLPLDSDKEVRNFRYPIPQGECDARPGEPACMITSKDVIPPAMQ